jgi:hypothetical protein
MYNEKHKIIDGIEYKKCSQCKEWKQLNNEYFYKDSARPDGFDAICKDCLKYKKENPNIKFSRNKGFNEYEIHDDITYIFLKDSKGEIHNCLIDTKNLDKVKSTNLHFHPVWKKVVNSYYARATEYVFGEDGKKHGKTVYLHHIIKPLPIAGKTYHLDHLNHDTLDNREENIEIKFARHNLINRKGANVNSESGVRHVNVINDDNGNKYWIVQFWNGESNDSYGRFKYKDKAKAIELANKIADELYPDQLL